VTDVGDAVWLCELLECGLLRGSFVPPPAIRQLRDLTRYRKRLIQAHSAECQRIQKTLEDAGIKLDSVATDVLGVSGRAILKALVAGERDPKALAELAKGKLRKKLPQLRQALRGRFGDHHALLVGLALDHLEHLEGAIAALDGRIDEVIAPFAAARDRLDTITGVGKRAAEVIIAEIGVDLTVFPTAGHLASWAGRCPGNNITGGKRRSGKPTKGNRWLADVLTECAWAAARSRDTYLAAQFWRLARRIGKKKAAMAVGHSILVIAWHLLTNDCDYADLGGDYSSAATPTEPASAPLPNSRPSVTRSPSNPSPHDGGFSFQDAFSGIWCDGTLLTCCSGRQAPRSLATRAQTDRSLPTAACYLSAICQHLRLTQPHVALRSLVSDHRLGAVRWCWVGWGRAL
jgi:transposase